MQVATMHEDDYMKLRKSLINSSETNLVNTKSCPQMVIYIAKKFYLLEFENFISQKPLVS
jgi:hypothetical protein